MHNTRCRYGATNTYRLKKTRRTALRTVAIKIRKLYFFLKFIKSTLDIQKTKILKIQFLKVIFFDDRCKA